MKTIRIMVPLNTLPNVKSATTLLFENLLPILRKKIQVHMIWFVYQPDRFSLSTYVSNDSTILDIHDFKNAIDAVLCAKPDLIYGSATWDLLDFSFTTANKYLGIPKLSEFYSPRPIYRKPIKLISLYASRFFENRVPTDTEQSQTKFMRRGRFFIYKFLFLLKTLRATKMNMFRIIELFFIVLYRNLTDYKPIYDSRFASTLHWLESEKVIEPLINAGFKRSSLVVTGSPMFDKAFQTIKSWKPPKNDKICILLITTSFYEHGFWTREQRDNTVKDVVREISNHKDVMKLTIKIHPSSEILSDYKSIVHSIDPSVEIYQEGDILDFLKLPDVVLSFGSGNASAMIYALIARKPIIICNFHELHHDLFLEMNLALECKKPTEIIPLIYQAIKSNPATEERFKEYVKQYLYSNDGLASERLSDVIIKLIQ